MPDLVFSGNEITDVVRAAALEGDGLAAPDRSVGVWEATTNLITNGGLETDMAGWNDSGAAGARVTARQKFGTASGQYVTDNAGANEGGYHAFAGVAATEYTVSAWVRGAAGGETVRIVLYDDVTGKQASAPITLTTGWQRITVTATTGGGSSVFRVYVETDVQQDITFQVDGVQAEAQPVATPYVETDGGTASRTVARVTAPASLIDEMQGWVAMRLRAGWAGSAHGASIAGLFEWSDSSSERFILYLEPTVPVLGATRQTGGVGNYAQIGYAPAAIGEELTVIFAWTATEIKVSLNGAAFVTAANNNIPILAAATFDIGTIQVSAGFELDGDVLWFACGTGVLTDADAEAIVRFPNSEIYLVSFQGLAGVSLVWTADTVAYLVPESRVLPAAHGRL